MEDDRLVPEFIADIKRRNTPYYSARKILLRQFAVFAIAVTAGILFSAATYGAVSDKSGIAENISRHFGNVFDGCETCSQYFTVIISASASDIRYLLLMFAVGFTYFCGIASSVLVMLRGFTAGYCISFLVRASRTGLTALEHPGLAAAVFGFTELTVAAFMIALSVKSVLFGYEFRKLRGRAGQIVRSPLIYRYMLLYLTAFGLIILINATGCFMSFLIF